MWFFFFFNNSELKEKSEEKKKKKENISSFPFPNSFHSLFEALSSSPVQLFFLIKTQQFKHKSNIKHQTQISQTKSSIKPSYQTYQTQTNRKSAQQSEAIANTRNPLIKQTHDPACHHQKSKQNKVGLIQIPNFRERESESVWERDWVRPCSLCEPRRPCSPCKPPPPPSLLCLD